MWGSKRRFTFMLQLDVSAAAFFTGPTAHAKDGSDTAVPAGSDQEIVVTGTRASLGRALDLKRRTFSRYDDRLIQLYDTGRRVAVGLRANF